MTVLLSPDLALRRIRIAIVVTQSVPTAQSRNKTRIARRALMSSVVVFLLIQAAFAVAVQSELIPLRDPVYFEKLALLESHSEFFEKQPSPETKRVLAIGSSRLMLGFDAKRFSEQTGTSAFNFGIPAAGMLTSTLYLQRLLEAGVSCDHLLFEIHPGFIAVPNADGPPFESRWLHAYRLSRSEVTQLQQLGYPLQMPTHLTSLGWINSLQTFRFPLLDAVAPRWLPCPYGLRNGDRLDERGWGPGVEPPPHLKAWALAMAMQEYAPVFEGYRVGGPGIAAVNHVTQLCQDAQVPLTLIVPPEARIFQSWYGEEGLRQLDKYVLQLRARNLRVIDARGWVPDELFADGHHLTRKGAAVFVNRLAQEWRQP